MERRKQTVNDKINDAYLRMMQFANNHKPHGGLSNLYLIQSKDEHGNVTGEYYGMNMFTDVGMQAFFIDDASWPTKLYVGQGTVAFDKTSSSLSEKIPDITIAATTNGTGDSTTRDYAYPMYYYDPTKYGDYENPGIITCVMKYMTCHFETNISGVTNDRVITEFGIGTDIDNLWTHSWVYDLNGDKVTITKHINESLYITVYMCYSYYETLITDGYKAIVMDDGVMKKDPTMDPEDVGTPYPQFNVITTCQRFFNRMWDSARYTYKGYNQYEPWGSASTTKSRFENNTITFTRNMSGFTMYSGSYSYQGYFDGFIQYHEGFATTEPQQLDVAERVVLNNFRSLDPGDLTGWGKRFGNPSYLPISQINVSELCLFDHKSRLDDRYVNDCDFYNDPNKWYDETIISGVGTYNDSNNSNRAVTVNLLQPVYYTNGNDILKLYVHENMRPDDPIISVNSATATLYATDKYWDSSSWIWITNFANIPVEAQRCRYWLTGTNVTMSVTRSGKPFYPVKYGTTDAGFSSVSSWYTPMYGTYQTCSNYQYKWWMNGNQVCFNGNTSKYTFTVGSLSDDMHSFAYNKYIVTFASATSYYLTDMSDAENEIHPTTNITPPFTTAKNIITECYRTENKNGIICLSANSGDEAIIIDLRGATYSQTLLSAKIATCIYGTNLIAYIDPSDLTKVKIYDVDQQITIADSFTITDGETDMNFIVGIGRYVWLTNSSSYTYLMDLNDYSTTKLDSTVYLNFGSVRRYVRITAVDDTMIIYRYNEGNSVNSRALYTETPSTIYNLSSFSPSVSGDQPMMTMTLTYINSHDGHMTLALSMTHRFRDNSSQNMGTHSIIADFGRYLYDGSIQKYEATGNNMVGWLPYGEYTTFGGMSPMLGLILNFLPARLIGTTHTIGCINHTKNVTNKQWRVSFTNSPLFGTGPNNGIPPGVKN